MARLRAVVVVVVVLVLGAWSCQVPTDSAGSAGSADVPISTTGLTALVAGEDWHYVGEAGEPAFENGWDNIGSSNTLAFRIREAGVVDVQGMVYGGTGNIFTLPEGYRPPAFRIPFFMAQGFTSPNFYALRIEVDGSGYVDYVGPSGVDNLYISGQFFLNPPT